MPCWLFPHEVRFRTTRGSLSTFCSAGAGAIGWCEARWCAKRGPPSTRAADI